MTFKDVTHILYLLVFLILQEFEQVLSEYCDGDLSFSCDPPYKCCGGSSVACCLDRNSNDYYNRSFKLHVWNMWYFWFIIIFIMMSCFGGCGYYRRRRLMVMQQTRQCHSIAGTTAQHLSPRPMPAATTPAYYAYTGPGAPQAQDMSNLPPPYYDVMTQPDMYPTNKSELPPYPENPTFSPHNLGTASPPVTLNAGSLPAEVPQPPPYSEVAQTPQRPADDAKTAAN